MRPRCDFMAHYCELDGEIIYNLAVTFVQMNQTLTDEQKAQLMALNDPVKRRRAGEYSAVFVDLVERGGTENETHWLLTRDSGFERLIRDGIENIKNINYDFKNIEA